MFTGIIQAVGEVAALEQSDGDLKLRIKTGKLPLADVQLGDSIATNGVCLTVTELPGDGYWADVSTAIAASSRTCCRCSCCPVELPQPAFS